MKKRWTGLLIGLGLALCTGHMTVSATSVGDVIAHARAVGMPESQIQAYTNQGMSMGREFTSAECDRAIAALDAWAAERDSAIQDVINQGTTTASEQKTETQTTAVSAAAGTQTTKPAATAPSKQEFIEMPIEEKVAYINSLSPEQRTDFINNMSNEERNSFLKQMDVSKQADIIASLADVGDTFGLTFSVDQLSENGAAISARDKDGNLVGVTTFGETVEQTGTPYTVPILIGGGMILLAAGGMGFVLLRSRKKTGIQ